MSLLACWLAGLLAAGWLAAAKIENAGLQLAIENIALSVLGRHGFAIFEDNSLRCCAAAAVL